MMRQRSVTLPQGRVAKLRSMSLWAVIAILLQGLLTAPGMADEAKFVTAKVVSQGVAQQIRVQGSPWTTTSRSLAGSGIGNLLFANKQLGAGDFAVTIRLQIDRLDKSAASVVLNGSHFGFEGSGGEMFTHGEMFGRHELGPAIVKDGKVFEVMFRRSDNRLVVEIDGQTIRAFDIDPGTPVTFGLRPHRSIMKVFDFTLAGNLQMPPKPLPHVDVYAKGAGDYHTYRIPAVVITKQDTLLAFCEGRKDGSGDAGNIDMLVRRSKDLGATWTTTEVIWSDAANTCGNACPVVDQDTGTIWLPMTWNLGSDHEGQIMKGTSQHPRHVYVTHSTDDGLTWSEPKRISISTRRDHWRWYATGPGNAIQLTRGPHKGRLLIPANHSDHADPARHPYRSHVFWSDDHGKSWELGGVHEDRTNESAVVELSDGSILQSMRSYHNKHNRAHATSSDGGQTWGPVQLVEALQTPVCQGNILRYSWREDADRGGKSRILYCSPAGQGRTHLTIHVSYDEGKTWPVNKLVHAGGSAYSNMIVLPNGKIGILFEKDGYQTISFTIVTLAWLEDGDA